MAQGGAFQTQAVVGTVVDVNLLTYTVDAVSEHTNKFYPNIPFSSPYCNDAQGEGFTAVPEVGSWVLLVEPGDGSDAILVAYLMKPDSSDGEGADYRGNRHKRPKSGDISMTTRDGNFFYLHRGGSLRLGATPIAQRMYVPLNNLIRDICQEYKLETIGGSLHWRVENIEVNNPVAELTLSARELAEDLNPSVIVRIGRLSDDETVEPGTFREGASLAYPANQPPVDLFTHTTEAGVVNQQGAGVAYIELEIHRLGRHVSGPKIGEENIEADGPPVPPKFIFRVDREGNQFSRTEGGVNREVAGKSFIRMESDFTHHVLGGYNTAVGTVPEPFPVATPGNLIEKVQTDTTRECSATMKDKCNFRVIDAATSIKLGGDTALQPVVRGSDLFAWLSAHAHPPTGGPPITPLPPTVLSQKVYIE